MCVNAGVMSLFDVTVCRSCSSCSLVFLFFVFFVFVFVLFDFSLTQFFFPSLFFIFSFPLFLSPVSTEMRERLTSLMKIVDKNADSIVTFPEFKGMVEGHTLDHSINGVYFVVVTLAEAEALRAVLHGESNMGGLTKSQGEQEEEEKKREDYTAIAISLGKTIIDASSNWSKVFGGEASHRGTYMVDAASQVLKFVNSELNYDDRQRSMILRTVERSPTEDRRLWFERVRSCRRRNHYMDVGDTSVRGIFDIQDSYRLLRMRAIFAKIKLHIASFGMAPFDAYRAMDTNRDGRLCSSELYGGLEWLLGLEAIHHIDEESLFEIIREMSSFSGRQCDGYVTLRDFRASFTPNNTTFVGDITNSPFKRPSGIPTPKNVSRELHEIIADQLIRSDGGKGGGSMQRQVEARAVTEEDLEKFEIRCKTNMSMDEVWNSRGEIEIFVLFVVCLLFDCSCLCCCLLVDALFSPKRKITSRSSPLLSTPLLPSGHLIRHLSLSLSLSLSHTHSHPAPSSFQAPCPEQEYHCGTACTRNHFLVM